MTKDTEKAFVIIYSEYLRRRSFGTSKNQAVRFDNSKLLAIDGFANWNQDDIGYCLQELRKIGFIKVDIWGDVTLLETGIEYIEAKPKEYFLVFAGIVKDLLSLVSGFLPI